MVINSCLPRMKFPTELLPEFLPPRRIIFNCDVHQLSPDKDKKKKHGKRGDKIIKLQAANHI